MTCGPYATRHRRAPSRGADTKKSHVLYGNRHGSKRGCVWGGLFRDGGEAFVFRQAVERGGTFDPFDAIRFFGAFAFILAGIPFGAGAIFRAIVVIVTGGFAFGECGDAAMRAERGRALIDATDQGVAVEHIICRAGRRCHLALRRAGIDVGFRGGNRTRTIFFRGARREAERRNEKDPETSKHTDFRHSENSLTANHANGNAQFALLFNALAGGLQAENNRVILEEGFELEFCAAETDRVVVDEVGFCASFLVDESSVHRVEVSDLEVTVFVPDGAMFGREVRVGDDDVAVSGGAENIFTVIDAEILATMVAVLRDDPADDGALFAAQVERVEVERHGFLAIILWLRHAGHDGLRRV